MSHRAPPGEAPGARHDGLTRSRLVGLGAAASLVPLNSTMIAVALPRIADDFSISVGRTSVLVTVYLVAMLFGQPLAGRVGDRFGVARTVETSLIGFAAASVVGALAPTFVVLVGARFGQAVFGAALIPGTQAMIRASAPPDQRGRLFGILGSMIAAGAASGPIIGGVLIQGFGWQAIFVANIPVVVIALLVRMPRAGAAARSDALDPIASAPLARNPVFAAAFGVQALTTLGQYMFLLVVPVVLDARGWSPASVGLALAGLTVGVIATGPLGGHAGDRFGRRRPVMVGVAVCAGALAASAVGGSSMSSIALVAALTVFGFGFGFALPSVQTSALEVVDPSRAGAAAGVLSMSRYVGSITTSVLVTGWIATDGSGAGRTFTVAAVAATVALFAARRLPGRPSA